MLNIIQIPVLTDNYVYLLHEPQAHKTAVVDPAVAAPVLAKLEELSWTLDFILNTHHHSDHVGANLALKAATDCQVVAAKNDAYRIPGADILVADGDVVAFGEETFNVIATPGHTRGHIVYYNAANSALFCGDTVFSMGCGRLFEGTAKQMWQSLQKIQALPECTRIFCAHEYTLNNGRFAQSIDPHNPALQQRMEEVVAAAANTTPTVPSTLAQELATNPFFRADDPGIQQAVQMTGADPLDVFTQIRCLKDRF